MPPLNSDESFRSARESPNSRVMREDRSTRSPPANGSSSSTRNNHNDESDFVSCLEPSCLSKPITTCDSHSESMKRLKKVGWYWGSISPLYAEKLLENEQDGTFLVRDSSSECYIFSMTFKIDGQTHHARIEHSKGHFSFGRSPKFFCSTIVDFIEQAVEYSHNGNMLFFLHRDPSMEGPVRLRMIPLSRLKGLGSLKHSCRFAILPYVRKDRIQELPIPACLKEYLCEPFGQDLDIVLEH